MKKQILILLFTFAITSAFGQVFNSAGTLKKGTFAVGAEPVIYPESNDFQLFLYGGYGLKSGIDMNLKLGVGNTNYYGIDAEWALKKNISAAFGFHHFGDAGLDGTILFNIPITSGSKFYAGLDMDLVFAQDQVRIPLWVPLGVEINVKNTMSFIFEFELAATSDAYHILGGGLMFYL